MTADIYMNVHVSSAGHIVSLQCVVCIQDYIVIVRNYRKAQN